MDLKAILALMQEMKTSGIENLEWEADGQSLRLPTQATSGIVEMESAPGANANATATRAAAVTTVSNTADVNIAASSVTAMDTSSTAALNEGPAAAASAAATAAIAATAATAANTAIAVEPAGRLICSPVVGIFYAAAAPDQDPFVSPGSVVAAGAPLGIIEAMKLVNEVTSPADGVVIEILVDNGQRVEYGQPLFRIELFIS